MRLRKPDRVVYVLFYPAGHRRAGQPCYVGKGGPRRPWQHNDCDGNKTLAGIYQKAKSELPVLIARTGLTNADACATEIALIAAIGRADKRRGPLVNHTDGGEGATGRIVTQKTRDMIRSKVRGYRHTQKALEKMRAAKLGKPSNRKGIPTSEATKALMRSRRQGLRWWHTPDGRSYKSAEKRAPEDIAGRGASYVNRHAPRPGLSKVLKGRRYSEAHCLAISLGKRAAAEARKAADAIDPNTRQVNAV